jgi:outer membrane murein-binding lipoprotein Lpp
MSYYKRQKKMKKLTVLFLIFAAAICSVEGCASMRMTSAEKAAKAEKIASQVRDSLSSWSFTIEADRMYPGRGAARSISSGYQVTVRDYDFNSHLPYFGEAWRVPYDGGHGLTFKSKIIDRSMTQVSPDSYEIKIALRDSEDDYLYTITVFDNGNANILVNCRNRESIRFSGNIKLPYD